jgi:transcriptional regulator with XRE-family HTH domain
MKIKPMAVGLAVRTAREAASLTQQELALLSGMHISSLSRSENGLRDFEFCEAAAVCDALNMNVETLRAFAENLQHAGVDSLHAQQADLRARQAALRQKVLGKGTRR